MDAHAAPLQTAREQMLFHLGGGRRDGGAAFGASRALWPALLAPYRQLSRLRHDFPLVLLEEAGADGFAPPLSTVLGRLAETLAPRGIEGERLRRHLLGIEDTLRAMVAEGATGTLSALWPLALERLQSTHDETARRVLAQAGQALPYDGELAACDAALPARLMTLAWRRAQREKAQAFRRRCDVLMRKLSDIRRAAWVHSLAGRKPEALAAGLGDAHAALFDFEVMSRLLSRRTPADELPAARRRRIESTLGVLSRQDYWPGAHAGAALPEDHVHTDCASAMEAFRARLPQALELLKAIAVAELECEGRYDENEHDALFEHFDAGSLGAEDFALLPDRLVLIPPGENAAAVNAGLMEMLSSGLPAKVLVQVDDLLDEAALGTGRFAFGVRGARLATTAMGLGGMFVLQCSSAAMPALAARITRGMSCRSPALFAVYAGAPDSHIGAYLDAAAATESRAFPTFCYDAAAGDNWATRFSLDANREPERDWPHDELEAADDALQRVMLSLEFTYADFVFTDARHAMHFLPVPRSRWHDGQVPVAEWLRLPEVTAATKLPYVLAVDAEDQLQRVLVDARLMKATRERLLLWRRLQEHAGIHDSHAERLLAQERAKVQAAAVLAAQAAVAPNATAPASTQATAAAPAVAQAATQPASDEAWIETIRCPSCNECQLINPRLFTYNENKQAYIADIGAGTYRDLVEAAESCQVAIIHPGRPRNPDEPGLEELIERAKPFL